MAGLYIHIPFCKTRCIYCGFYSTTRHELQDRYVDAVIKSLSPCPSPALGFAAFIASAEKEEGGEYRAMYAGEEFHTLYIGGGTPSQLSHENIQKLLSHFVPLITPIPLWERLRLGELCEGMGNGGGSEITIECNPDDITPELASLLYKNGVNRISMGVQSFSDDRLRFLHRRHNADQARDAVRILRNAGFQNISIDLMFGFPGENIFDWEYDIDEAVKLGVEHISAYSLMYEEGTPLYRMLERGEIQEIDEELSRQMYYLLIDKLQAAGYEHYEISNFARPGFRSKHNSSYWHDVPYLGLGSGAHSYDLHTRSWNGDLTLSQGEGTMYNVEEVEVIDEVMHYNDMITTALRTKEGLKLTQALPKGRMLNADPIPEYLWDYMMKQARPLIDKGLLAITSNHLHLTREGLYTSDDIMSELIYITD